MPRGTFSVFIFGIQFGTTKAPADPCATAAQPEKCHYNQAVLMLASMTSLASASKDVKEVVEPVVERTTAVLPVIGTKSTLPLVAGQRTGAAATVVDKEHVQPIAAPFRSLRIAAATDTEKERAEQADLAAKEEQSFALLLALGALEGEDLPAYSLENATMQLEDVLDKVHPGALAAFRARRLAEAMNHHGPPKPAEQRASEALSVLEQVKWPLNSVVARVIQDLYSMDKPKPFSLFQWAEATNSASGGQVFILLVFVLSVFIIDRVAQDAVLLGQHQEQGYGAMGHTPAVR